MAPETVTAAMFFGEDREMAVAATGFEEALAGLIRAAGKRLADIFRDDARLGKVGRQHCECARIEVHSQADVQRSIEIMAGLGDPQRQSPRTR